jgi:hypothetical protein
MKHAHSLEEERQALLEQIHASREAYRRMLMQSDAHSDAFEGKNTESHMSLVGKDTGFPRSITIRWFMQHPYVCAAVAAAIVVVAPLAGRKLATRRTAASVNTAVNKSRAVAGDVSRTRRTARTRSTDIRSTDVAGSSVAPAGLVVAGRAATTGLATAAMMILRDPAKMRTAAKLFSGIVGFLQARRSRRR